MADDPTGRLIIIARDVLEAAGYAVWRTTSPTGVAVRGKDRAKGDAPPMVQVAPVVLTPGIVGEGMRAGVGEWRHAFRCYGPAQTTDGAGNPADTDGDRQAVALGLALVHGFHNYGPFTFPAPDQPGRMLGGYRILFESMVGPAEDPQTREPYVVVTTRLLAPLASWPV